MKTVALGPFLGMNTRRPDFALHVVDEGDFVRDAANVDLDDTGHFHSRRVPALAQAMAGAHSLHKTTAGAWYLVRGGVLYSVTLPAYTETLVKILASDDRMSYVEYDGSLYYSNGTDKGRITNGAWYPMGLPTPVAPAVSLLGGALLEGSYRLSVSYYNDVTGEEGGVSPTTAIEVATGGVRVTLPAAVPGATHVRTYLSSVNGSIPMLAATVTAGTASVDLVADATGTPAFQRFEQPLPAGMLFLYNSMICCFTGKDVFEGIPARPGYYIPLSLRDGTPTQIPFPAVVTNAIPAQNGVYITADKTYWFQGPRMAEAQVVSEVLPYGAVPGTAFSTPDDTLVGWFGLKGIVLADTVGKVDPAMADQVDQVPPATGCAVVFEDRGFRNVVSCGWAVNLKTKAATRYTDFAFTSIVAGYGTKADGLYDMSPDDLASWTIDMGKVSFGKEQLKRIPSLYLGAASAEPIRVEITTPDGESYVYTARSCSPELEQHRVDLGRGLQANWFGVKLEGDNTLTLATVSPTPVLSPRRV